MAIVGTILIEQGNIVWGMMVRKCVMNREAHLTGGGRPGRGFLKPSTPMEVTRTLEILKDWILHWIRLRIRFRSWMTLGLLKERTRGRRTRLLRRQRGRTRSTRSRSPMTGGTVVPMEIGGIGPSQVSVGVRTLRPPGKVISAGTLGGRPGDATGGLHLTSGRRAAGGVAVGANVVRTRLRETGWRVGGTPGRRATVRKVWWLARRRPPAIFALQMRRTTAGAVAPRPCLTFFRVIGMV